MPGVNLSQSIAEKSAYQAKNGSEKGRLYIFIVFCLTLATWGGVRAGMFWYDKKIDTLNLQIEERKLTFNSLAVSDIADVDARLNLINQQKKSQIYPKTILTALEETIVPANKLTEFKYDFVKNTLFVSGESPAYKELAQQVMSFKSSTHFSDVVVTDFSSEKKENDSVNTLRFEVTMAWGEQK